VPFGAETPEIFTRRRRTGVPDAIGRKMGAECVGDALAGRSGVDVERIAVQRRDFRRPGRTRRRGLGVISNTGIASLWIADIAYRSA
jgi:hypothetical protein